MIVAFFIVAQMAFLDALLRNFECDVLFAFFIGRGGHKGKLGGV